jgi:hypothetical protein
VAHQDAKEYFGDIDPDRWHYNYKGRVNFVADPAPIFRHVIGLKKREYIKKTEIPDKELEKYVTNIEIPYSSKKSNYDEVFSKAVDLIVDTWLKLFEDIENGSFDNVAKYIKDWNLDTGVDESQIVLWKEA